MPVHARQTTPAGHGEVLCSPPFATWREIAEANATAAGVYPAALQELRALARQEAYGAAVAYSATIGLDSSATPRPGLLAMTGHQPELYHPGVWVKDFLLQRFAEETGAEAIDLVVDTDAATRVELKVPCLEPDVRVCTVPLAALAGQRAYVQLPAPSAEEVAVFEAGGAASLRTLPAPALLRHFETFCKALGDASAVAEDLPTAVTAARRRYERPANTTYLELPVSRQAGTRSFRLFAASLLLDAARFHDTFNSELAAYRQRAGIRSAAQPFPDLGVAEDRVESPFWVLRNETRATASVDAKGTLFANGERVGELGADVEAAERALRDMEGLLAPKAVALTLFERLFVADVFIHGTGGGRYDRVTDAIISAYYGVPAPAFVVASMTLLLPLGGRVTTDADVAAVEQLVQRLQHNPDQLLADVEFDTPEERAQADDLAARKARLVAGIAEPGADKKALGTAIKETNRALVELLAPLAAEAQRKLGQVKAARDATAVLTDRTYPFCLWDPLEVMDKVR